MINLYINLPINQFCINNFLGIPMASKNDEDNRGLHNKQYNNKFDVKNVCFSALVKQKYDEGI